MKLPFSSSVSHPKPTTLAARAFTLPEVLVAMTVFALLLGGIVSANIFGLSMFYITQTKLDATDDGRKVISRITDEIRRAKSILVGDVANGVFTAKLEGEIQQGGGLLIYPTTNTTPYVSYFVNPSDQTLRRTTSNSGTTTIIARSVTNTVAFAARDYLGQVLTNNQERYVIRVNLEFYKPSLRLQAADSFRLETSTACRAL